MDVATTRTEFYDYPAALPTVEHSSIKHDLYRRDFTINAMAVSLAAHDFGRLLDFFGGLRDIENKVIRVLHNLSFIEDPTRIFRAIRYENRYGFRMNCAYAGAGSRLRGDEPGGRPFLGAAAGRADLAVIRAGGRAYHPEDRRAGHGAVDSPGAGCGRGDGRAGGARGHALSKNFTCAKRSGFGGCGWSAWRAAWNRNSLPPGPSG